jgi:hypothetical protein
MRADLMSRRLAASHHLRHAFRHPSQAEERRTNMRAVEEIQESLHVAFRAKRQLGPVFQLRNPIAIQNVKPVFQLAGQGIRQPARVCGLRAQ